MAFVKVRRRDKKPVETAWQCTPRTAREASAHRATGGNVGVLCGHHGGNIVMVDLDKNAPAFVARYPFMAATVQIYRDDAPERRKYVVRVHGDLPPAAKDHEAGFEILSTGNQGVVLGTHPSGALYVCTGDALITLTRAQLGEMWEWATGSALTGTAQADRPEATPDAAAVKRSLELAKRALDAGKLTHKPAREYGKGGVKLILDHCPFNPEDDPHPDKGDDAVVTIAANGAIGAMCQHARCQERIKASGRGGWQLLKEIAGVDTTAERAEARKRTHAIVNALRGWLRTADFADHVPPILKAENGYRTAGTDKRVADAALDLFDRYGRTEGVPVPLRALRSSCNLGCMQTAGNALARLGGWFVVEDTGDRKPGDARTFSIAPPLVEWATGEVAQIRHVVTLGGQQASNLRNFAALPLTTHRAHDAFCSSTTPTTEEAIAKENARREEDAQAALDAGDTAFVPQLPIKRTPFLARRLAALLPSAGPQVLLLLDALADGADGDRTQIRERLYWSASTCSRVVGRARDLGLVEADRHTVTLPEEWRAALETVTPHMPTAGNARRREDTADAQELDFVLYQMDYAADLPEEKRERLNGRIDAALRRMAERSFGQGATANVVARHWREDLDQPLHQSLRLTKEERKARIKSIREYGERGLVKAGTPEQWAQALQTARDRLYGHRLGEWAAEFAPDGTKRMSKRAYAQARARLEANFAPFFEWLQEAHGSKFVAMAERDIVAKCAEWAKTNAAPLRSSLPAKTTPAQVQEQAAQFGPMWWDFVDDLNRREPEWRTHYTPEAAVSAFFDYCNAAPLPTFHFEAGAALAAD